MPDKRIRVWVTRFKDRSTLMLQWTDPDTNRVKSKSAKTGDEAEAEARRVDLEADLNAGRYQEVSRMTWERFRELFEDEYLSGLRKRTQKLYANTMDHFERLCNPKAVGAVTNRTVSAFVAALRKEPGYGGGKMKASTIKTMLIHMHSMLSWADEQKIIKECPPFPTVKVPGTIPQPVPTESFEKLYDKAAGDRQMQVFLLCGWLAGLRLNEAYELEWDEGTKKPWLDFGRSRIILPAEFVKGTRDQWVSIDPQLREALEEMPRQSKKVFRFTGQRGNILSCSMVGNQVRGLAEAAGVKLSMKSLRRGFGCRYATRVPAQVLQRLMRHGSINTTMKYYVNVDTAAEVGRGPRRGNP